MSQKTETEWAWKMISMDPFGVVLAQIKEEPGPGRHFRVRHLCAIKGKSQEGKWVVGPEHLPILELARGEFIVSPQALHWMVDTLPGNEEQLAIMFGQKKVQVATPAQATMEASRLRKLEGGLNGGQ